ncbi:MAG TPA: hypothetical protein VGH20_22145, partial [Myxococcales bacterium]
ALLTPLYSITQLVKIELASGGDTSKYAIVGGPKDFVRLTSSADTTTRLVRSDGAIIHFSMTGSDEVASMTTRLLAYDFELYFPSACEPKFVRFDLNLPGHLNEDAGLRSHLHPGTDAWAVPSAVLSPAEILSTFLYGMQGRRVRS